MRTNDDKNQDTSRRSVHATGKDLQDGLGQFSGDGQLNGDEPIRVTEADDKGVLPTSDRSREQEDTSIKKILERLDALEKRHLEYVNAHKVRLSARLREAENNQDEFLQESSKLRNDIYAILQDNSNTSIVD